MKIRIKKVEYKRKCYKYIKKQKYLWVQINHLLLTIKI